MRRNEKFLTAMAAAFMTTAAVSFSSMAAVDTDFHRFVVGTIINGVPVSGMTTADAEAYIEGYFNGGYTLEIEDTEGVREAITDTSIGYTVDVTGDLEARFEGGERRRQSQRPRRGAPVYGGRRA